MQLCSSALALAAAAAALSVPAQRPVALGLVKYAHNACVCVADAKTGELLYAGERERLSRVKNDGGCVGDLARHALAACGREYADVAAVVANDHHRAVAFTEDAARRADALGSGLAIPLDVAEVLDPYNAWPGATELSHHRAHALGAVATHGGAPGGIVLVWDGMGDTASRFRGPGAAADRDDPRDCVHVLGDAVVPWAAVPDDARECETVYREAADSLEVVFKRWCAAPAGSAALFGYNDWFDAPLDSLGAAYSAVAHAIFGDWNACGKVMGLAPWGRPEEAYDAGWGGATRRSWAPKARAAAREVFADPARRRLYAGAVRPGAAGGLVVDRRAIRWTLDAAAAALGRPDLAFAARDNWRRFADDADGRACCAVLAHAAQRDLEAVALAFADDVAGGASRLILCGGVALNSALNGRVEASVKAPLAVPPAPGDEGCALGCCVAALARLGVAPAFRGALPYAGAAPPAPGEVDAALDEFAEWLDVERVEDAVVVERCAAAVAAGTGLVFWFDGRPEFGPRALGHRSIVAPATVAAVVDEINRVVKGREDFRPLAPAVLEEEAPAFFAGGLGESATPYMSRVWPLTPAAAERAPACAHADRTARPQTVSATDPSIKRYRRLLELVFAATGCPCALNTSFNTKPGEPIVESPRGACASFVAAAARRGAFDLFLAFPGILATPRACPSFSDASCKPARRHARWEIRSTFDADGASSSTLYVLDLDEPDEDGARTGRGVVPFADDLEAAVYEGCDGAATAAELAAALAGDGAEEEDVYRRLAGLWRRTLVRF